MKNEKYSHEDFTQKNLLKVSVKELNNTEIYGSCFHQDNPDTDVFPPSMTGVIFISCNLDNCAVPVGNTVKGGCHRRIIIQNDMAHWVVDKDNNPVEPVCKADFEMCGASIDPKDIPLVKMEENILKSMPKLER